MLYDLVFEGDVPSFLGLLNEDPHILSRCVNENSSTPLHVAADMGHLEMVKSLLKFRHSMCLARDHDGRNPLHVAAIQGHVNVLEVLHEANPYAAQERTCNGETILHLCIKHSQLKALEALVKLTDYDGDQIINTKDNNENTVLHLAVTSKQPEMVEYLLAQPRIEKNALNKNNMTAVDIHLNQSKKNLGDKNIEQSLKQGKVKPGKDALNQRANDVWLEKQRTSIMVVASLIAAAAFQV